MYVLLPLPLRLGIHHVHVAVSHVVVDIRGVALRHRFRQVGHGIARELFHDHDATRLAEIIPQVFALTVGSLGVVLVFFIVFIPLDVGRELVRVVVVPVQTQRIHLVHRVVPAIHVGAFVVVRLGKGIELQITVMQQIRVTNPRNQRKST